MFSKAYLPYKREKLKINIVSKNTLTKQIKTSRTSISHTKMRKAIIQN
jgi:hypothetical protein